MATLSDPQTEKRKKISIKNGQFVDSKGRTCLLRGVNLGGSSKLPINYDQFNTKKMEEEFYTKNVSFVNRPFPLAEAPKHFKQLKKWGLNFIRLIVTWEAIEHDGPGIYDVEYLTYIKSLIELANEYDLLFYIDPHQDVWSRWTGGDGAPLWTLECIGLLPQNFEMTKTAYCVETCADKSSYPRMIWPTNYFKYACATMFTLFWGGEELAPSCKVDGVNVQTYLQSHYINSMVELAKYLVGLENVIGFGTMNEPGSGYIGVKDLSHHRSMELRAGYSPTPIQGMVLSEGIAQDVGFYSNGMNQHLLCRADFTETIKPADRVWKEGYQCVWLTEGVWSKTTTAQGYVLNKPDYFATHDFGQDYYVPFAQSFISKIREHLPDTLLFVELVSLEFATCEFPAITSIPNVVNATHWYDPITYFMHQWLPYFTVEPKSKRPYFFYCNVVWLHDKLLKEIKDLGYSKLGNAPTLIGETGIPFALNNGKAFQDGDYSDHIAALDHTISRLESNLLSYTLWCYTSDNNNEFGDQWNREDFSIVNNDNGRAMPAFIRPFCICADGFISKSRFDRSEGVYLLHFESSEKAQGTEIYFPRFLYESAPKHKDSYTVSVSDGTFEIDSSREYDVITYLHSQNRNEHHVILNIDPDAL